MHENTSIFFSESNFYYTPKTGENLQHHCHLLTCKVNVISIDHCIVISFHCSNQDILTHLRIFFGQLKNSGHNHTTTIMRHCIFCDDILTIILTPCAVTNLSKFYVWWLVVGSDGSGIQNLGFRFWRCHGKIGLRQVEQSTSSFFAKFLAYLLIFQK